MNREDPYRQQTESTRKRIGRATISGSTTNGEKPGSSSLPPRSEVHHQKRAKSKTKSSKQSFPLIRLQVVFFILLPIIIFAVYTYRDSIFPNSAKTGMEEKGGYEPISFEDSKDVDKKNTLEDGNEKIDETDPQTSEDKSEAITDSAAEQTATEQTPEASGGVASGQGTVSDIPNTPVAENVPTNNSKDNSQEIKLHTVQQGETLYRIAMKYYKSKSGVDIIKKANNLKSDSISVGQTLKIPI